ncbi:denticleless protein homolog isoform X1 [Ornithorhynchus anatinus]|uniref:Denticleless protein homolog n=1 Tax=Ornithorhynchus anatinus TaxID=9258 RepID=A0A6I8NZT7_ORNAN|nr:denticleless protein homolog isoform X1 [Ornithorhynchus anatinus]
MLFRSLLAQPRQGGTSNGRFSHYPLQSLLAGYQCSYQDDHLSYGEMGVPVPPFGCTFSTAPNLQHILAVANEEGFISLYNTESRTCRKKFFKEWMAHSNAVFDLTWVPGEHRLVTASGDQTARLWDVKAGELIGVCKGHQCSLKSVAFSKFQKAVFCTGGRDGNIMVWDTRCNKKDGFYRQVNQISGAHNISDKQTPLKFKKKKLNVRGLAPSVDFQQSVTVVVFQDEHTLVSAGAVDGIIKVWDLRKNYTTHKQEPVSCKSFSYPGNSTRKLGYSSLVMDSTCSTLFANCTDDNIYMFNMTGLQTTPVATFSGHQNSTFYVKSSISPDDQFLVSGSSDEAAYIWKISEPQHPPTLLLGHSQEVTTVCWCPSDFTKIATCSDDNTMRVWRLRRGSEEKLTPGKMALVGWAYQKKAEERAKLVEEGHIRKDVTRLRAEPVLEEATTSSQSTPAKAPRVESSPSVSSPRSAACAPNCTGDLPLSSNTPTSSFRTPPANTQTPVRRRESISTSSPKPPSSSKMSIRNWVTRTPYSTPPATKTKTPSPRKILVPVTQTLSQVVTVPKAATPSGTKAKRRLDSSCPDSIEPKCLKNCSCVMELDAEVKKAKLDLCCLAGNQGSGEDCLSLTQLNGLEGTSQGLQDPSSPSSPLSPEDFSSPTLPSKSPRGTGTKVTDKENSSPNWLAAMGARWRTEKAGSRSPSSNSPSSSQTPNARRQDGKNSPGPVPTTPVSMRKICTYFHRKSQDDYSSPEQSKEL